jgi:hypothetical protein
MAHFFIRHRENFLPYLYCIFTVVPNYSASIVELTCVIFIVTRFETLCEKTGCYDIQTSDIKLQQNLRKLT